MQEVDIMSKLELNNIYDIDCIQGMKKLKPESIDLIIADPPYFKVINEKMGLYMENRR